MNQPALDSRHDYDIQGIIMSKQIEWITAAEAAKIMKVSVSNVRYLCRNERIKCHKFGRDWQVSKQAADNYIRSNRDPDWLYDED